MDRLIKLEPSNVAAIRIDPSGKNCSGELTLRNVMYTMPVAFRIQALNKNRYSIKPQSGVIPPLAVQSVEITYILPSDSDLPEKFPHSDDAFLLHSVVVPGAAIRDLDTVPNDWFTARKKQVFQDSGLKVMFVGAPVLARAIARGRADLVQLLLEFGPDVESRGRSGSTPLEVASGSGLTEGGATINGRDQHGWTALHRAAFKGKIDAARTLLEKGINIDSKDEDGYTALHCAVEAGHTDVIELLVKKNIDVDARTNKGVSALQIAESLHYAGITRVLINGGASREDTNNHVTAPTLVSSKNGLMSARKEDEKTVKKRPTRARVTPNRYDRSSPALAVL
ncbi:Protein VAPYRIN [Linum grandiflorum]